MDSCYSRCEVSCETACQSAEQQQRELEAGPHVSGRISGEQGEQLAVAFQAALLRRLGTLYPNVRSDQLRVRWVDESKELWFSLPRTKQVLGYSLDGSDLQSLIWKHKDLRVVADKLAERTANLAGNRAWVEELEKAWQQIRRT